MPLPRSIFVVSTVAELRATPGPWAERYVFVLETGRVYRWLRGSPLVDDGRAVLTPTVGGFAGAWLLVRAPDAGAPLPAGDVTITLGQGAWRTLPAGTLTGDAVATLSPINASAGDTIEISRLDTGAYSYGVANGGPGAGTLVTMPPSARSFARAYFDGTDWQPRSSGLML
jgi:hypothetical protein